LLPLLLTTLHRKIKKKKNCVVTSFMPSRVYI
jgi:hypothetical protein